MSDSPSLDFRPLRPALWPDFERLFGERGACGGCWCMTWRLTSRQYEQQKGEGNREAMRGLVAAGVVPGILAYADGIPVGWCAIGPRTDFARLQNSRVLAPVDEHPVWSLTCFFIHRDHRRRGLSRALIRAAIDHARRHGARIVEAYPILPKKEDVPAVFAFTGLAPAFLAEGFREVARRSPTRPVMRYLL